MASHQNHAAQEVLINPLESRLLTRATKFFSGNTQAAQAWLMTPLGHFNGLTPLEYARDEAGAKEVENLLGRLEHGVFS